MALIWSSDGARRSFAAELIGVVVKAQPGDVFRIDYPDQVELKDQADRRKFGLMVRQWAQRAGAGSVSVNPGPASCRIVIGWK